MSQQPSRITRRLETQPVRPPTGSGDPVLAALRHALMDQVWDSTRAGRYLDTLVIANGILGNSDLLDALSAYAGWRPPARVIEDPAEMDTCPIGSVVLGYGVAHQAVPGYHRSNYPPLWLKPTGRPQTSAELLADCRGAGVTILHTPTEIGDTE